jgi:carbamoyltransferase
MKIIGIHDGHNASLCVLDKGEMKFAIQEERFTYVKNQGGLPYKSIEYLREHFTINDEDVICFTGFHVPAFDWTKSAVLDLYDKSDSTSNVLKHYLKNIDFIYSFYSKQVNKTRLEKISKAFPDHKAVFIEHHLCHAATTYYGLGNYNEDILIITADGDGDGKAGSVYLGKNGELTELDSLPAKDSLGRLYSYSTFLFNMIPYEHEYKIMGLAPYCKDRDRIERCKKELYGILNFVNNDDVFWKYTGRYPTIQSAGREIKKIFNSYRFDIYSSALQEFTEELLVELVRRAVKKFRISYIALSGGIFMNVKANMLIADLPEVRKCFVYPSCGDETNPVGLTQYLYFQRTGEKPKPLEDFYFGDYFQVDESELGKLDSARIEIKKSNDIESEIALLISKGEIAGRIKGRMEFGARALGNRSILANPLTDDVVKTINDMVKNRDFWMPFAPSVLAEDLNNYFFVNDSVVDFEYMIFTCKSRPEKRYYAKNTLHPYDFTARPHSVRKEHNPGYHRLITRYKEITGEALILNTSFNLHGFPIVRTQEQALHVFMESGLKYLALDDYLLTKV